MCLRSSFVLFAVPDDKENDLMVQLDSRPAGTISARTTPRTTPRNTPSRSLRSLSPINSNSESTLRFPLRTSPQFVPKTEGRSLARVETKGSIGQSRIYTATSSRYRDIWNDIEIDVTPMLPLYWITVHNSIEIFFFLFRNGAFSF